MIRMLAHTHTHTHTHPNEARACFRTIPCPVYTWVSPCCQIIVLLHMSTVSVLNHSLSNFYSSCTTNGRVPRRRSRHSDSLLSGRSRNRIPIWDEILRTSPDRPWGPLSLLYNGYSHSQW